MLGWCIVTLADARLKASVQFSPLRGMYQVGTCKRRDSRCTERVVLSANCEENSHIT